MAEARFSSFRETLDWLYGVQQFGIKLGTETMEHLLQAMDLQTPSARVLHVAGTNGKGSTCAFAESICRHAGYRTGLFTSPHLISFTERIRVDFHPAEESILLEGLNEIHALIESWDPHPTFFEIATALAMWVFQKQEVEVIILETGMGGRLDSTNAVPSDVSVITAIGMDHQKHLGDTLEKIAREKAGILKAGTPVVLSRQEPEAREVVLQRAAELDCPVIESHYPIPEDWETGIPGSHQRWNAASAIRAARALFPEIDDHGVEEGIKKTEWPGRFQTHARPGKHHVVLDGAHNEEAMEALVETWQACFPGLRARVIFGTVKEKSAGKLLEILRPVIGELILTTTPTDRGVSAEELADLVSDWDGVSVEENVNRALRRVEHSSEVAPVLITGSLFLIGKALEILSEDAPEWESSLQ